MLAEALTTAAATNLTALGILAVVVIWGVTKGIPMLRDFLTDQRVEFMNALIRRDEQFERVAAEGHAAARETASSLRELKREIRDNPPPCTTGGT